MDFLDDEQITDLLGRVAGLTERGTIAWKSADAQTEYSFMGSAGTFIFTVQSKDADDVHPILFRVYSGDVGRFIATLDSASEKLDEEALVKLLTIYHGAKRQSFKTDSVVEKLFETLSDLDTES